MSNRWHDIPQLPMARYQVNIPWGHIERSIETFADGIAMNMDPDYQRCHVWTVEQRSAYIEYQLSGGEVGRNITWNALAWPNVREDSPLELVDGKQRLESVRMFMRGEVEVFGMHFDPERDKLRIMEHTFVFRVCSLDRAGVLRLYLNINGGGTPHTSDELDRVRAMLGSEE